MKKILYILTFIFFGLFGVVNDGWGETATANLSILYNGWTTNTSVNNDSKTFGTYFTITWTKEDSPTNPTYLNNSDGNGVKLYATKSTIKGGKMTISTSASGVYITNISITGKKTQGTVSFYWDGATSNTGYSKSYTEASKTQSVNARLKETGGSKNGQYHITSITVTYILSSQTPTTYDTITFRDIHNNKWTQKTTENNDTIFLHDTVPSKACKLNGWVFAGWSTDSLDETKIIKDSSYIIPTKNDTLYVFYRLDSLKNGYKLVESNLDDWSGEYLIVSGDSVAFDGSLSTLDAVGDIIKINVSNKSIHISTKTESSKFIIIKKLDGYSILSASRKYIGRTANTNGLNTSESDIYTNTISFNNGITNIIGEGGAYLRYNASAGQNRFRYYQSSTYTGQKPIQLYKKQSGTSEYSTNPQCFETNISVAEWFEDKVEFDIGDYEGTYTYNKPLKSCDSIRIKITNDNNEECIRWFQVPIFAGAHTLKNDCNCDVVILSDSVLTITNNIENANVTIYPGGVLEVGTPSGNVHKTYTMKSLILRRDNDSVPQLLLRNDGFLDVKTKMFFEMRTDGEDWRWLTLPDTFRTSVVNEPEEVVVKYYDGDYRAKNGKNGWKEEWNGTKNYTKQLAPGEGCIFGVISNNKRIYKIELDTNILSKEKNKKYIRVHSYFSSNKPNDSGWNLVGNPFMTTYNVSKGFGSVFNVSDSLVKEIVNGQWTGKWITEYKQVRYIVMPSTKQEQHIIDAGGYEQICLEDGYKLKPFTSFFIQVKQGADTLVFYSGQKVANAPVRMKTNKDEETFLRINVGSIKTGCYISNKFTNDYEIGDDMESLYSTYQFINNYKLLYSAINDSIIEHGIQVHGTGLVSLDDKTNVSDFDKINIFCNNHYYDLLNGDTPNVQGDFILFARRNKNDIPTGINETIINEAAKKFIHNGNVYILRENKVYNILGTKIR